jgi:hypothetical protein
MKKVSRGCFCGSAESRTSPGVSEGGSGYCGVCQVCGARGHRSYYPGPVAGIGAWCDRCYLVERHRLAKPGAFFYAPGACIREEGEEYELTPPFTPREIDLLARLVGRIEGETSRLLITFENGAGIDFWLQADNRIEMSFTDAEHGVWGSCTVSPQEGAVALRAAAAGENLRTVLRGLNIDAVYFE